MKILIITPYAEPEKGACVVRVNGFRDYFTKEGHNVSVYAPKRANTQETLGVKRYSGIVELQTLILQNKFDVIIGTSPPLTHNFFALLAAKAARSRFFLDAKDPFTDVMKKMDPEKAYSLKFRLFEFMESFTHKHSDRVIFLNKPYLDNAVMRFSLQNEKVFLAQNGSNTKKVYFDQKARKNTRSELGLGDDFTFIYVGGIGDKDLDGFVKEGFSELAQKHNARVVFILSFEGTGIQKNILQKIRNDLEKNNLSQRAKFIFNVEFENLCKYLSAADCGLVAYPDFEMQVVGAKVFDYIAAGLWVAAKASIGNTELKNFIESNKLGFIASNWNGFNKMFGVYFETKFSREKIIKVAEENSRDKSCRRVLEELQKIV